MSQLVVKDRVPLQLCKTRESEGKRASRCNCKWPRILEKLHEHVYIMYALHCHSKCQNRECIQHTLHDREVTANRNYNKAWNLQRLIFSWFWIVGFFLLTIHCVALMTMTHHLLINFPLCCTTLCHMPCWSATTVVLLPIRKAHWSQRQQGRDCTTGILTSCPVTWLANKDLYQLVGADLELSRQLRRNVGRKRVVCWNTKSPFACVACFLDFGMHSLNFEKVVWKRFIVLIVLGRRYHRKEHSAHPIII